MSSTAFFSTLIIGIATCIFGVASCHKVPTGHAGVISVFGKVQAEPLPEGIHFLNPLAKVHDIDCRQDVYTLDSISFPSQDQLGYRGQKHTLCPTCANNE